MSTLIQINNLHRSYGPVVIFDDANLTLSSGEKIGVIGRNGAGKSTLCKLLTGAEEPEAGRVTKSSGLRLGYLEQETPFRPDEGVLEFLMRYTGKADWECGKLAGRFQLKHQTLEAPVDSLAGGYQTRVKVVAMLLRQPNFLILDEPTNYLDLKTLLLLERFLRDFAGGYLVVSHDREFLKKTCDQTLEVERGKLTLFPGGVEAYLEFKEEEVAQSLRFNKNVQAKRKHLQEFVDRYRTRAATASRAQSKIKEMSRLQSIEVEQALRGVNIRLPAVAPKRGTALRCERLEVGYPDKVVAEDIYFEIERGDHVAVLGDNGQGKTTFLRTIASELSQLAGTFRWGHGLTSAYYAQHVYRSLDDKRTIFDHLEQEAASDVLKQEILDLAGSLLFRGDDVDKPISVLSGGERARVCLAGILLSKRPVLLLDEPTNHLDFETVESLAQALKSYAGTIFFVSHDRTFVQTVATKILDVKNQRVTLYPDTYESYVYQIREDMRNNEEDSARGKGRASDPKAPSAYALRKQRRSALNRLRRRLARAEADVAKYETERQSINQQYLENPLDYSKEKQTRLDELGRLIGEAEKTWVAASEEIEKLEAEDE